MSNLSDKLLFKVLKRPIRLKLVKDVGSGHPVILLHGIGRNNEVWDNVIKEFELSPGYRVIAFDLLGFGASPKPDWINYSVDDHAAAVINSINKLHLNEPVTLVGHSMGSIVAARIAKLLPSQVKHLILFEMPIYSGLPENRLARIRLAAFTRYYDWVINYQPRFDEENLGRAYTLGQKLIGFSVDKKSWTPFIKSLENTILKHQVAEDIKDLPMTIDAIYGSFDTIVIRGHTEQVIGTANDAVSHYSVRARHVINKKASKLIVERVVAGYENEKP
ncbi:MAG TPA: alpha/beta fold hydrolase [Candidatus Sulfotelmatobacter sp.]|nr:alpha/beta fold hydrolase [Candidatus Sulfotelmatobacter sp.]